MGTTGVEWGWKVPCTAPGCTENYIKWGGTLGPPTLYCDDPAWSFNSFQNSKTGSRDWKAYCPTHAAQAKEWEAKHASWREARRAFGRKASERIKPSFWDSLLGIFLPGFHRVVGGDVQEWEKSNPEPLPPWRA